MRRTYLYYVIGAALCFALGYAASPQKTEIREVEVIREVIKHVKGLKETIVVVKRPDGTTETRTDRTADEVSESDKSKSKSKTVSKAGQAQYGVAIYSTVFETTPSYQLTIDRRIIGNLFLGVTAESDFTASPTFGVGVRFEF